MKNKYLRVIKYKKENLTYNIVKPSDIYLLPLRLFLFFLISLIIVIPWLYNFNEDKEEYWEKIK